MLLLAATDFDLRSGSVATFAMGLAAAYLGFTIAFGGVTIDWADAVFARRFAGCRQQRSHRAMDWICCCFTGLANQERHSAGASERCLKKWFNLQIQLPYEDKPDEL
jgi:hypothetical protein